MNHTPNGICAQEKEREKAALKAQKAVDRLAAKEAKEAAKAGRARERAAISQARGSKAIEEVEVVIDSGLTLLASGRQMMDALEAKKLAIACEPGLVPGVTTIRWRRRLPADVRCPSARSSCVLHAPIARNPLATVVHGGNSHRRGGASDAVSCRATGRARRWTSPTCWWCCSRSARCSC